MTVVLQTIESKFSMKVTMLMIVEIKKNSRIYNVRNRAKFWNHLIPYQPDINIQKYGFLSFLNLNNKLENLFFESALIHFLALVDTQISSKFRVN